MCSKLHPCESDVKLAVWNPCPRIYDGLVGASGYAHRLVAMEAVESWASTPGRRRNMQAIRSRDTKPELAVRRLVHAAGLRYRVGVRPEPSLRRTADLVFTKRRVAVFIDGCFWHGCPEPVSTPSSRTPITAPITVA